MIESGKKLIATQSEAAAIHRAKNASFTPDSYTGWAEITVKNYIDSFERSEMMHRVRTALAAFPDDFVISMISSNQKIPLTGSATPVARTAPLRKGEKERERDLGMPIWWRWEHDVTMLKVVTHSGIGVWKKIISDGSAIMDKMGVEIDLFAPPSQFDAPPMENETPWVMELSAKALEKRFYSIAKNIQPVKWLKLEQLRGNHVDFPALPPGSPDDRLQYAPVAIAKPRTLFPSTSSTGTVSSFFTAAPKKAIGPSTKPGAPIAGVAAITASIVDPLTEKTVELDDGQKAISIVDETPESSEINLSDTNSESCAVITVDITPSATCNVDRADIGTKISVASTGFFESKKRTFASEIEVETSISAKKKAKSFSVAELEEIIDEKRSKMQEAVVCEDFETAAVLKKELVKYEEHLLTVKGKDRIEKFTENRGIQVHEEVVSVDLTRCTAPASAEMTATTASAASTLLSKTPSASKLPKKSALVATVKAVPSITGFFKKIEAPITLPGEESENGTLQIMTGISDSNSPQTTVELGTTSKANKAMIHSDSSPSANATVEAL